MNSSNFTQFLLKVQTVISHMKTCPDAATAIAILFNYRVDNNVTDNIPVEAFFSPILNPQQQADIVQKVTDKYTLMLDTVLSNVVDIHDAASDEKFGLVDHHKSNFQLINEGWSNIITSQNDESACKLLYKAIYGNNAAIPLPVELADASDLGKLSLPVCYFRALFDEKKATSSQIGWLQNGLRNEDLFKEEVHTRGKELYDVRESLIQKFIDEMVLSKITIDGVEYNVLTGPTPDFSLPTDSCAKIFEQQPNVNFTVHYMQKPQENRTQFFFRSHNGQNGISLNKVYGPITSWVNEPNIKAGGHSFAGGVTKTGLYDGIFKDCCDKKY